MLIIMMFSEFEIVEYWLRYLKLKYWKHNCFCFDLQGTWWIRPKCCWIRDLHVITFRLVWSLCNSAKKIDDEHCSSAVFTKKTVETTIAWPCALFLGFLWFSSSHVLFGRYSRLYPVFDSSLSISFIFHFNSAWPKRLRFEDARP